MQIKRLLELELHKGHTGFGMVSELDHSATAPGPCREFLRNDALCRRILQTLDITQYR